MPRHCRAIPPSVLSFLFFFISFFSLSFSPRFPPRAISALPVDIHSPFFAFVRRPKGKIDSPKVVEAFLRVSLSFVKA